MMIESLLERREFPESFFHATQQLRRASIALITDVFNDVDVSVAPPLTH